MIKKNEFENFCDELSDGQVNKVNYVREQLRAKYKNNTDMYLIIKAEAQEDDYIQFLAARISLFALIISCCSFIFNISSLTHNLLFETIVFFAYILVFLYVWIKLGIGNQFKSVGKWRKYVLVVIDDLIKESKQNNKNINNTNHQ